MHFSKFGYMAPLSNHASLGPLHPQLPSPTFASPDTISFCPTVYWRDAVTSLEVILSHLPYDFWAWSKDGERCPTSFPRSVLWSRYGAYHHLIDAFVRWRWNPRVVGTPHPERADGTDPIPRKPTWSSPSLRVLRPDRRDWHWRVYFLLMDHAISECWPRT